MKITWLPTLVLFEDYGGNWEDYLDALFEFFKNDFIYTRPTYNGKPLRLKRYPMTDGKEATFWHIISSGNIEADRTTDLRRCERIRWPRPIIERSADPLIKVWKNRRNSKIRVCLWLESCEYLAILDARADYHIFWTAYPVTENHRKRKLQNEFEKFCEEPF